MFHAGWRARSAVEGWCRGSIGTRTQPPTFGADSTRTDGVLTARSASSSCRRLFPRLRAARGGPLARLAAARPPGRHHRSVFSTCASIGSRPRGRSASSAATASGGVWWTRSSRATSTVAFGKAPFARVRWRRCPEEFLVTFSCKGRRQVSLMWRQAATELAAFLQEEVVEEVGPCMDLRQHHPWDRS